MHPKPVFEDPEYQGSRKLQDKIAIITGGDSGIGRAVATFFASEGAHVVIAYLDEHEDAIYTQEIVRSKNRRCLAISGDIADPKFCQHIIKETIREFNGLDILVNNAAVQYPQNSIEDISTAQLDHTFKVNYLFVFLHDSSSSALLKIR